MDNRFYIYFEGSGSLIAFGCDTSRGSPAGAGEGCTADHLLIFFCHRILAVRKN